MGGSSVSGIGGWLGGGEALIVAGLCWLMMRYVSHLPAMAHPWIHRLVIIGMYAAGTVLVVSVVGLWLVHLIQRLGGFAGGTAPGSGIGWALVTIGALALAAAVAVALVWMPNAAFAYVALAAPLVLALAPGGFAHQIYALTSQPAHSLVTQVAVWAGG
jgi:hypothetical protein